MSDHPPDEVIEARKPFIYMNGSTNPILVWRDWLHARHPDGYWTTIRSLMPGEWERLWPRRLNPVQAAAYDWPAPTPVVDPLTRPSHWDEDPDWPVADWKYEVANDDTRQGYHEWIAHNKETAREDDGS